MRVRVSWAAVMAERSGGDGDGSKTAGWWQRLADLAG